MKIHTNTLDAGNIRAALARAIDAGHVGTSVMFAMFATTGSRSHARAWEVQIGTHIRSSRPEESHSDVPNPATEGMFLVQSAYGKRKYRGIRQNGAGTSLPYAATYDEWGWFIAYVMAADPNAKCGRYNGRDDFNRKTKGKFATRIVPPAEVECLCKIGPAKCMAHDGLGKP